MIMTLAGIIWIRLIPIGLLEQQVFEEYVPTYPLSTVKPGIWQKFSFAQVEGFVLDCRSQRDVETDPDDTNKSMLDGNNLGPIGQLGLAENGLITSTARWKIIFSSVISYYEHETQRWLGGVSD